VTTVQLISFDFHGNQIFKDKYDEICLADDEQNPLEIRQDQAPG